MMLPRIDIEDLNGVLAKAIGRDAAITGAEALGDSSRATPYQIEVDTGTGGSVAFLLRYGDSVSRNEVIALQAMADHAIPTPRVVLWDESGSAVGEPLFVSELINGEPLLPSMVAGEQWAVDLYIETACALQAVESRDLPAGTAERLGVRDSADDVIETAFQRFAEPDALHEAAYRRLKDTMPEVPEPAFSNGDLWPENLLVRERRLVGVIDWQHAGWTDPLFEFLLPFFLVPELRNRGIEERFCERKGFDTSLLHWYHGVEFFDSLSIVLKIGEPYEMHTAETLTRDLEKWLSSP